jgi:tetratricopeptide (TPR) repeat protein
VRLDVTPDPTTVLTGIAAAYGVTPDPRADLAGQVSTMLQSKQALLVLDGAEQAGDLAAILRCTGNCAVLITSRDRLAAPGALPLDVLPLPPEEALALFVAHLGRELGDGERPLAEEICRTVGYLPLALRLAGSALRVWQTPLARYLERLRARPLEALHLKEAREWSVRVTFDLSYERLTREERAAFALAGEFGGADFDLAAAAGGLGVDQERAEPRLDRLVALSLLERAGERYAVHPLLKAYARQARVRGRKRMRARLADHYLAFAQAQAERGWEGYDALERELPNLQGGFDFVAAAETRDDGKVRDYTWALYWMLNTRGYWDDLLRWLEETRRACEQLGDRAGLAASYNNIGSLHHDRGDYGAALEWYEKSVALKEQLGDRAGLARSYNNIGLIHKARGDYGAALEWYEKSLALCEQLGDRAGLATSYNNIGSLHHARGDYGAALEWYEKSLAICEQLGDRAGLATSYNNIGELSTTPVATTGRRWSGTRRAWRSRSNWGTRPGWRRATTTSLLFTTPVATTGRRWSGTRRAWRSASNWGTGPGWRRATTTSGWSTRPVATTGRRWSGTRRAWRSASNWGTGPGWQCNYSGGDWKSPFWACGQRSAFADLPGDAHMKGVGGGRHPLGPSPSGRGLARSAQGGAISIGLNSYRDCFASLLRNLGATRLPKSRRLRKSARQFLLPTDGAMRHGRLAMTGTVVTVENLFYNVPARLKFLRSEATERQHIDGLIYRYAMAYPHLRFSLLNDGRLTFQSLGTGELYDVLIKVYGLEISQQMLEVQSTEAEGGESGTSDLGSIDVYGYISIPSLHRANRNHLTFFVNGRWVQDRMLSYAVSEAYHTLLPTGRYPIVVLGLKLSPSQVDINVHPTKSEIRFLDSNAVFAAVQKAVRRTLLEQAPIPKITGRPLPWLPTEVERRRKLVGIEGERGAQVELALDVQRAAGIEAPAALELPESAKLPPLRVLGQIAQAYIIAEGPEGLYLIDQHAAHERVLYERLVAERAKMAVTSQTLLEPLTIELPTLAGGESLEFLNQLGFAIEPFGGDTYLVRAVPIMLAKRWRYRPGYRRDH